MPSLIPAFAPRPRSTAIRISSLAPPSQLFLEGDERMHDLDERRLTRTLVNRACCPHDRPHLRLVDLRPLQSEPAAACPEHRIGLPQRADPAAHPLVLGVLLVRE